MQPIAGCYSNIWRKFIHPPKGAHPSHSQPGDQEWILDVERDDSPIFLIKSTLGLPPFLSLPFPSFTFLKGHFVDRTLYSRLAPVLRSS